MIWITRTGTRSRGAGAPHSAARDGAPREPIPTPLTTTSHQAADLETGGGTLSV